MFKAFRIRLVTITMIAISVVVLAITSAINVSNFIQLRQRADSMLELISEYNGTIPQNSYEVENKVDFYFSQETPFQTRYFVIRVDKSGNVTDAMTNYIAAVSVEDIQRFSHLTSQLKNNSKGTIGKYRFLVKDIGNEKMITFLDRSQDAEAAKQLLGISVLTAAIGISCICILMIILSKRIVQPFIRNHEKQKEFITDAGHELKTPLAIIRTNAEVLEVCCGENEWIDSIKNQTERLDGLVKGLLQLAKSSEIPNDGVHIVFPLSTAIYEVSESFLAMAKQKGLKMTLNISPNIDFKGDPNSIRTLVSILVDNAIKYAAENGDVKVTLKRMGKSTSKTAKLIVENTTSIDDKEDVNRFFERFYRSESSRSRQTGGYGIGLSVAKTITEAHKGKITATKSKNGKRIYFTVII